MAPLFFATWLWSAGCIGWVWKLSQDPNIFLILSSSVVISVVFTSGSTIQLIVVSKSLDRVSQIPPNFQKGFGVLIFGLSRWWADCICVWIWVCLWGCRSFFYHYCLRLPTPKPGSSDQLHDPVSICHKPKSCSTHKIINDLCFFSLIIWQSGF